MVDQPEDTKAKGKSASADDRTAILPTAGDNTFVLGRSPSTESAPDAPTVVQSIGGDDADDATIVRPRPRGRPRLIAREPDGSARELPLTKPEVMIGRASSCDIVLASPEVSRQHARIVARGDEHALVPVGARHNTYVNGEAATAERLLRHGDVIQLASERLLYAETEDVPAAENAAAAPARGPAAVALGGPAAWALGLAILALGALALFFLVRPGPQPVRLAAQPPTPAQLPERAGGAGVAADAGAVDAGTGAAAGAGAAAGTGGGAASDKGTAAEGTASDADTRAGAPRELADAERAAKPEAGQREEQVRKLVYQGDIAFLEKKYTTPPDGSAVYAYSEALKLDPANERARSQIVAIVDEYLTWAEGALRQRDRSRARLFADKAAYVHQQAPGAGDGATIERRLDALARALAGARVANP